MESHTSTVDAGRIDQDYKYLHCRIDWILEWRFRLVKVLHGLWKMITVSEGVLQAINVHHAVAMSGHDSP